MFCIIPADDCDSVNGFYGGERLMNIGVCLCVCVFLRSKCDVGMKIEPCESLFDRWKCWWRRINVFGWVKRRQFHGRVVYPESKLVSHKVCCFIFAFYRIESIICVWKLYMYTYFTWHCSRPDNAKRTMSEKTGVTTHSLVFAFDGTELMVRSTNWSMSSELVVFDRLPVCFFHRSPQPSACRCMQSSCWLVEASLLHCEW